MRNALLSAILFAASVQFAVAAPRQPTPGHRMVQAAPRVAGHRATPRRGDGSRSRRAETGGGFDDGLAFDGTDLATSLLSPEPPPPGFGAVPSPYLPPLRPVFAPPPPCPLIIKIGGGLQKTVRTRVVTGRPACR